MEYPNQLMMSTEIGDIIFNQNKTLLEVLDEFEVSETPALISAVNDRLDDVNSQLRDLGILVDSNQISNNTRFVSIETTLTDSLQAQSVTNATLLNNITDLRETVNLNVLQIANLQTTVNTVETTVTNLHLDVSRLNTSVNDLGNEVSALSIQVGTFNNRILTLEAEAIGFQTQINNLNTSINRIISQRFRDNLMTFGNEFLVSYKIGTSFYWIRYTFSGSIETPIMSNTTYNVSYLNSAGNSGNTTFIGCAQFEVINANAPFKYQLSQGPIYFNPSGYTANIQIM